MMNIKIGNDSLFFCFTFGDFAPKDFLRATPHFTGFSLDSICLFCYYTKALAQVLHRHNPHYPHVVDKIVDNRLSAHNMLGLCLFQVLSAAFFIFLEATNEQFKRTMG